MASFKNNLKEFLGTLLDLIMAAVFGCAFVIAIPIIVVASPFILGLIAWNELRDLIKKETIKRPDISQFN